MTTTKDPQVTKLTATVDRLEKIVAALHQRIIKLERENARLKGSLGRAHNQIGVVERLSKR